VEIKKCGCPEIIDSEWDLAEHAWGDKSFYSLSLPMFFHIPIGMGRRIEKAMAKAAEKDYKLSDPPMVMSKDGIFSGAVMVGIEKPEVTDPKVIHMADAEVVSKIHLGPWKELNRSVSELLSFLRSKKGTHPAFIYFWYVTCPECADEEAQKTVIFAQLP
jgi:hypothetical protein